MGKRQSRRIIALLAGLTLVMAACGSSDSAEPGASSAPGATSAASSESTAASSVSTAATSVNSAATSVNSAASATTGSGAASVPTDTAGAKTYDAPTGKPFLLGVQNPEGDPAGSFPEYSKGVQAAVDYVNAELGGLGGRPIKVQLCKMVITPDDSQRCANELSSAGVDMVLSTLNFFGNQFPMYAGSNIPVLVGSPITVGDFTTKGAFAIGAGGGCLGTHTGIVEFITDQLPQLQKIDVERISSPFQDSAAGRFCYKDLQEKPLDVLVGTEAGASKRAGTMPNLKYLGIPIVPATPDVTAQATQTLDFKPDVITYVAQTPDCFNFLDALSRLGWTVDKTPLVFATSCADFDALRAAGPKAVGVYFVGALSSLLSPLDTLDGKNLQEATTYQTKGKKYGLSDKDLFTGFGSGGFKAIMNIWQVAQTIDGDVTGTSIKDAFAATNGSSRSFGGGSLNCSGAPAPYISVCNPAVSASRWNGKSLDTVEEVVSGIDLVAGTKVRTG